MFEKVRVHIHIVLDTTESDEQNVAVQKDVEARCPIRTLMHAPSTFQRRGHVKKMGRPILF